MTVLHDVTTASTLGTTVASPLNITHAAGAGCAGVVVCITIGGVSTDVVTGVTYGGIAMTRVRTDNATSAEAGRTYIYFLGGRVPQASGNQTCTISYGADVTAKSATVTTLRSSFGWKAMTVATSGGVTNSATTTGFKFVHGGAGQGESSMTFVSAFSGTAGAMSATCPPTPTTNVTTMADDITGTLTGGTFRQTVATENTAFPINLVQAADDFCGSGISVVEYGTDWSFNFPTPEWDEEHVIIPVPLPDITYANNFDGGPNETTITTGNSGGNSGRAWDAVNIDGTGASIVYSTRSSLTGRGAFGARVTSGSVSDKQYFTWSGLNVGYTDMYTRMYARCDSTLGFQVLSQYVSNTRAFMFADSIRLSDASSATRYTGVHTFVRGEPFRIEVYVRSDLVTGHMQARLFWGANINGTTPDEIVGSLTDNWNLGSPTGTVLMGNLNTTTNTTWSYDSLALSTVGWIGPELQREYDDSIWPSPDFDLAGELATPAVGASQFIFINTALGAR